MTRLTLVRASDRWPEAGAFIRSRIPPEHRSCWSLHRYRVRSDSSVWQVLAGHAEFTYHYTFWFARRYDWLAFEMKMALG